MARVKIEPGGKVLIGLVILSALLFLFFRVIASRGTHTTVSTEPVSATADTSQTETQQTEPEAAGQPTPREAQTVQQSTSPAGPAMIFFAFNRARINKNVYCIFDRIKHEVRRQDQQPLQIVVEGNADSIGPKLYNIRLSRVRAARVADSLSRRLGLPMSSFKIVANGFSNPIASNSTAAGRAENRRTEVYIYH